MSATEKLLRFGVFELNLATEELRKSGIPIKLPPQPFKLLVLLASHAGQIVARDEIQKQIWGEETYVDFEQGVNKCIKQIRNALNDNADSPLYIETLPRHGYRFLPHVVSKHVLAPPPRVKESSSGIASDIAAQVRSRIAGSVSGTHRVEAQQATTTGVAADHTGKAAISMAPAFDGESCSSTPARIADAVRRSGHRRWLWSAAAVVVAVVGAGVYWRSRTSNALTGKDTIVIAEFDNRTGDPVFDGTLRQGLTAQLAQSPFLNILSDQQVSRTLALMTQREDARFTPALALEVCVRTQSAAILEGDITMLGKQYVLGLKALDCNTGDELAVEQFTVDKKEQILPQLGKAASRMRRKLGESIASVQKFDVPLENVTTASLDALQAYTLGFKAMSVRGDYAAAIPPLQRATSLDPDFAMAHAVLGVNFNNQGQITAGAESLSRAYALRERVSGREKFYIESHYYQLVTGDLEAARATLQSWGEIFPRDAIPPDNLSYVYATLGDYDSALTAAQKRLKLAPDSALSYGSLVLRYLNLNRVDEATSTAQEAIKRNLDAPLIRLNLYLVYFLRKDTRGMEGEISALSGKPGRGDEIDYYESDTAAYFGQFIKARELTQRAVNAAQRTDEKETAALYEAEGAIREALIGNADLAKRQAHNALALSSGRDVETMSGIALGLAGDSKEASQFATDLSKRFPEDTVVRFRYLPSMHAAATLADSPVHSIEALAPAAPYELGAPPFVSSIVNFSLYAIYLRGQAYLAALQGGAAALEFQRVLDHPGIVVNEPIGALARLGLGRSYALSGETGKAKKAYQDFLALWKEADPDIPIYRQAKTEYAKLH